MKETIEATTTVNGQVMIPITSKDNTIINHFIQTMNFLVCINATGAEYEAEVNKFLDLLVSNKFVNHIDITDTEEYMFTYNFEMIINDVPKLTKILNEFNDKIDFLRTARYTGQSRIIKRRN